MAQDKSWLVKRELIRVSGAWMVYERDATGWARTAFPLAHRDNETMTEDEALREFMRQYPEKKAPAAARNADRIHALIYHPTTTRYLCGKLRDDTAATFAPILTTEAGNLFDGSLEMTAKSMRERTDGRNCSECERIVFDEAAREAANMTAFRAEQRARIAKVVA